MSEDESSTDEQDCVKHDFGEPYTTKETQESNRVVMEAVVVVKTCKKCGETVQLDSPASNYNTIREEDQNLREERPEDNVQDAILMENDSDTNQSETKTDDTTNTVTDHEEKFVTEKSKPSQSGRAHVLVCDSCTKALVYDESEILNEYDTCPDCENGKVHLFRET